MKRLLMAAAAVLALAGCGISQAAAHPFTTHVGASVASVVASAVPSPSPSPVPARMTRKQAAAAYVRIVDPANRAIDVAQEDYTDQVPLAQFHADVRTFIRADRTRYAKLAALRWPRDVQPYITSMIATLKPADMGCMRAWLSGTTWDAVYADSYASPDCTADTDDTLAATVRTRLGLPVTS